MKRFMVFFGDSFYPRHGMEDFAGDYSTYEEAVKSIKNLVKTSRRYGRENQFEFEWAQVFDLEKRETINYPLNSLDKATMLVS